MAPSGHLSFPDGFLGPPSHQQADGRTLELVSRSELQIALGTSLRLFCAASGSRLNESKSKGTILGSADVFTGADPVTGVFFLAEGESDKHLAFGLAKILFPQPETSLRL